MCTATYIPGDANRFYFTVNRDEAGSRTPAEQPTWHTIGSRKIWFPRDPDGGGTWLAAAPPRILCLMNGAFGKPKQPSPSGKSRGLVLLDAFQYSTLQTFMQRHDFAQIAPFSILEVNIKKPTLHLAHIHGNDRQALHRFPADSPNIWSSPALYAKTEVRQRKRLFDEWLKRNTQPNTEQVIQFHRSGRDGKGRVPICLPPDKKVFTQHITVFRKAGRQLDGRYYDLIQDAASDFYLPGETHR